MALEKGLDFVHLFMHLFILMYYLCILRKIYKLCLLPKDDLKAGFILTAINIVNKLKIKESDALITIFEPQFKICDF